MANASIEITMSAKEQQIALDYLTSHIDEIYEEMWRNTVHVAYNKAKEIAKDAVDMFYGEWSGHGGGRTEDLYDAYDIGIRNGWQLIFEIGSDMMGGYHHQGAEFVYENSFVRGYHGGSAGTDRNNETVDSPHFRIPAPQFTTWGSKAPRGTRIRDRIVGRWNIFNESKFKPLQYKELVRLLSLVRERLGV